MKETINFIKERIKDFKPEIGVVLGSGLGDFAERENSICIPYSQIPGFEQPKVEGHKGQLVFSEIEGKKVVMMQGRYHYYEGYPIQKVVYPIKVMKYLGCQNLIITNAAGAINREFAPADLMFITDHINFMGINPLIGANINELGVRFPDMSEIYSKELIKKAEKIAKKLGIKTQKGVYAASSGPSYETPAEIKMFEKVGASAVGMSTVPEATVANWCGMKIIGISCITNYAAGVKNTLLSHEDVINTAKLVKDNFKLLLNAIISEI